MTITIVDDCQQLCRLCETLARRMGFRTEIFVDGQDFLDNFTPKRGVVLLGVKMPKKSAFEVLIELEDRGWNLLVVTMSGAEGPEGISRLLAMGAKRHLSKPFSPEQLERKVLRVLGKSA